LSLIANLVNEKVLCPHMNLMFYLLFCQTIQNLIHLIQSQGLQNPAPRLNAKQPQSITAMTEIRKDYKIPSLRNTS